MRCISKRAKGDLPDAILILCRQLDIGLRSRCSGARLVPSISAGGPPSESILGIEQPRVFPNKAGRSTDLYTSNHPTFCDGKTFSIHLDETRPIEALEIRKWKALHAALLTLKPKTVNPPCKFLPHII
jgi:hypothetical protein